MSEHILSNAAALIRGAERVQIRASVDTIEVDYALDGERDYRTMWVPSAAPDYRAWIAATVGVRPERVALIDAQIDMTEVARVVRKTYGIACVVEHSGGGTATIYAGPPIALPRCECGCDAHASCLAGPGTHGWGEPSIGNVSDFYIGIDDHGEDVVMSARDLGAWTTAEIASLIAAQVAYPNANLSADHLTALGFDGTGRGIRAINARTPDVYAAAILRAIRADVESGIVPAPQVGGFADLHDHVDANEYLINAGVPCGASGDTDVDNATWNLVADIVDHAIKCGALR